MEEIRSILVDSRMDQGGSDSRRKHFSKGRKRTLERKRKRQGGIIKHKKPKPKRKKETSSAKNASQASKSSKAAAGKDQKTLPPPFETEESIFEKEMKYLESKLGIRNRGSEALKKLDEELEEDGLGDINSFISSLTSASFIEQKFGKGPGSERDQVFGTGGAADELEDVGADEGDDSGGDEDSTENEDTSGDDERDGEEGEKPKKKSQKKLKKKKESLEEDALDGAPKPVLQKTKATSAIYGENITQIAVETGQKYVPPHMRRKQEASATSTNASLKRSLKGLLNRLTEDNISSVTQQIVSFYRNSGKRDVSESIISVVMASITDESLVVKSVILPSAAVVVALHGAMVNHGHSLGALVLEQVVLEFSKRYKAADAKPAANLLLLVAHLFNFKLFEARLIFDIINLLTADFSLLAIDLLLILLQNCGFELRGVDPQSLKEIIIAIQNRAREDTTSSSVEGGGKRVQFMLDMIYDLKNNKRRQLHEKSSTKVLQGWLSSFRMSSSKKGVSKVQSVPPRLHLSLEDIMNSSEVGRWWVIGGAYKGKGPDGDKEKREVMGKPTAADSSPTDELMRMAIQQRMNTDLRKAVFCVVMGAQDYMDASEKIIKLNLKAQQIHEALSVVVHCCLQQKAYNPFFSLVLRRLCVLPGSHGKKYRFTLQLCVFDVLKTLADKGSGRRAVNAAKLVHNLICVQPSVMTLHVLKVMDINENLDSAELVFLHTLFSSVLSESQKAIRIAFLRLSGDQKDNPTLRTNITYFFRRHLALSVKMKLEAGVEAGAALKQLLASGDASSKEGKAKRIKLRRALEASQASGAIKENIAFAENTMEGRDPTPKS